MWLLRKIGTKLKSMFVRERLVPVVVTNVPCELLNGKTALVSGGSSGIGFGIAKKMSESGCKVILIGTNIDRLKSCAQSIDGEYVVLDVRNVDEIKSVIDALTRNYTIDILVNSAGVHGTDPFGKVSEETWNRVIDINLRGLYFLSQAISNHMKEKGVKGHILNVSSASSLKPSWTPYEISKRALDGITQGMAHKLIPHGIIVNGIAPGPTATPMLKRFSNDNESIDLSWPENPSKRMSSVEEIANLALFMVSGLGNGIVGDTVFLTGGSGTICIDK